MTRSELRRALRERRKALRQAMAGQRRQAREALAKNPVVQRARNRRRIRRMAGLAVLALLLLFVRCECEPPPPAPPPAPPAAPEKEAPKPPKPAAPKAKKPGPLNGTLTKQRRAKYEGGEGDTPSWLDEFRLQVAARSPRLAQCFTGTEKPGALRWTSSVNAESGAVSDHVLEPLGLDSNGWAVMLSQKQRECVVRALSNPGYHLTTEKPKALSNRISLVIEF